MLQADGKIGLVVDCVCPAYVTRSCWASAWKLVDDGGFWCMPRSIKCIFAGGVLVSCRGTGWAVLSSKRERAVWGQRAKVFRLWVMKKVWPGLALIAEEKQQKTFKQIFHLFWDEWVKHLLSLMSERAVPVLSVSIQGCKKKMLSGSHLKEVY